jgi:hypothetical protein
MPASAFALVATFGVLALAAGILAARLIGPFRPWTPLLPAAAAFGGLYLIGHRWVVSVGPQVTLWGWEVALPFDAAVAIVAAIATAALQRGALRLLQPEERRAGRDGLA